MATTSSHPAVSRRISLRKPYEPVASGTPVDVIDVVIAGEYRSLHAPVARPVRPESLAPDAVMASRPHPGEPLYILCESGERATRACAAAGYSEQS